MTLGEVLKQERQRTHLSVSDVASKLGISVKAYESIEAGTNHDLEGVGNLLLQFNELIEGQINQLFYPCGLPFQTVTSYNVST